MKELSGHLYKRGKIDGKLQYLSADSEVVGTYYVDYMIGGKRCRKCLDTEDHDTARERWAREKINLMSVSDEEVYLRKLIEEGERAKAKLYQLSSGSGAEPLKDVFDRYVNGRRRRAGTKERTLKGYRQQFDRFARWAPASIRTMRDLAPGHCEAYVKDLEASKKPVINAETIKKHLSLLSLIWKTVDPAWRNPWDGLRTTKQHTQTHYRKLSLDECKAVYAGAKDEDYRLLIALGYSTGQRLGDLTGLRWNQVDFKAQTITVTPAKTDRRKASTIVIPMTDQLVKLLAAGGHHDDYVLGRLGLQYLTSPVNISRVVGRIMDKAGIVANDIGKPSFHSFRHTFASMLANSGAPLQVQTHLTSHSVPGISMTYTHMDLDVLRKWITKAVKPI